MKKMPGDIILLYIHVYHNQDHMIYGSWNIRCNRQKFLLFLDIFLPFQTPDILKNQNFTIEKKRLDILSFYSCVPKMTITWWMVPEISSTTDRIFCHFEPFYALLPKKSKFWKKRKKKLEILLFYTSVT